MEYEILQRGTKEFEELMKHFEKQIGNRVYICNKDHEDKAQWERGAYYTNGKLNELWLVFMWGYEHGKKTQWERDQE